MRKGTTLLRHEVARALPREKKARARGHETGREPADAYDVLMIATGRGSVRPSMEGAD